MTFFKLYLLDLQQVNRTQLNTINSNSSVFKLTCKQMNSTKLNRINSNAEVSKRDYSTAQVKEIAKEQKQLTRTSKPI